MAAKDFGAKYVCFKCSTKFYDLKKPEAICPKCGANQKDGVAKPTERKSRLSAVPKIQEPVPPGEAEGAEDEVEAADDEVEEVEEEP